MYIYINIYSGRDGVWDHAGGFDVQVCGLPVTVALYKYIYLYKYINRSI
jgi:hypothetical protein